MKLKLENVVKNFAGVNVLDDISIDLINKNVVTIIGPSGGGKSTLLYLMSGYKEITSGRITINGHELQNDEKFLIEYRKKVGIVFQSYNLFPHLTAIRNITLVLEKVHNYSRNNAKKRANNLMIQFQLEEHKNKFPIELSGGQQQRLAIARAMSYEPELLFFDEPSAALDPELTVEVLDTIKKLKEAGTNLIIVTHEMGFARSVSDHVMYLNGGKIVENGTPSDIFDNPKSPCLKNFLSNTLEWKND